ncbi:MAG: S8 family serine peptidase [Candidatus Thorarchaeota archaeon]
MRYVVSLLFILLLFVIPAPLAEQTNAITSETNYQTPPDAPPLNFQALSSIYGTDIPVMVTFTDDISAPLINQVLATGVRFSFGSPQFSHVNEFYLLRGTASALEFLMHTGLIQSIDVQSSISHIQSTRDVSIPEINADDAWNMLDGLGRNLTGEDILIADLDTGVDWKHPDLWFPGDTEYSWIDSTPDGKPTNGSDYVDLNGDTSGTADEVLHFIDLDSDGTYNTTTDWLWVDNITQNAEPDPGEPFFVVNDTNGNDALDVGETLVMLTTPKTKYIVEKDGTPQADLQVWMRGVNLTTSTHQDTDGHGTAVAGILVGGQLGYREYVGVAPGSELMMIRVLGSSGTALTVEEGLTWAYNHGADVILTEIGSWTYEYLDGSDSTETLINTIVSNGVPVISPAGNLGGKDKHALFTVAADTPHQTDFTIPAPDGTYVVYDISNVYITVLSINSTDFWTCNFSLIMNLAVWSGPPALTIYLHPGNGYLSFNAEPAAGWGGNTFIVESFISTSSRSTQMLGIWIHGTLPTTSAAPWHQLNITAPSTMTFHAFISDDQSSWSGGCVWKSDISNDYEITWPSTADDALSVASYRTRSIYNVPPDSLGGIASFSSRGPRIDDTQKLGIAAPGGYDIISDYSNASTWQTWFNGSGQLSFGEAFGSYRLFSGTSASGPHVAGCAALMLQRDSSKGSSVKTLIQNNARSDGFTGAVPNSIWGYGKLDVQAAVAAIDVTSPTIHSVGLTPSAVEYYHTVEFEVNVTDDTSMDSVYLKYQVNGWTSPTWSQMTLQGTGNFTVTVGPFAYNSTIYYTVYANDTLGNDVESTVANFTVGDSVAPFFDNFWRSAATPGAGSPVEIRVDVVEPSGASGVDTVLLNWSASAGVWTITTMSGTDDTYSATLPGQSEGTIVHFYFIANDTAGNLNVSSILNYTTVAAESVPPSITDVARNPEAPDSTQSVTVTANVTDASGVDMVILEYYNGSTWINVTMSYVGDHYEAVIPALPGGTTVTYRVHARDNVGNWAVSSDFSYTVTGGTTTTTTTTTSTTTTTTTSSSTLPDRADPLMLGVMFGIILILIALSVKWSRREQ